ncbi:MAG: hypothetical protein AMXMBFR82_53740 [Candidatus Hydrogenedentota bacterium]
MRVGALLGLILSAAAALSCGGPKGVAVARLSADGEMADPVFVSETVHGTFYVENVGTDPFRIDSVRSLCVCTTPKETNELVEPGDRAAIHYEMVTASAREKSVGILVQTSPPLPEPLRFTAGGTWKPVLEVGAGEPEIVVEFGEPFEREIALRVADGAGPLRVTGAKARQDWADVSLTEPGNEGLPRLVLRSKEIIQPGSHDLPLALDFERQEPGRQDTMVKIRVQSDITLAPERLMVELAPGETRPTVELTIKSESGKPFLPRSIRAENFEIVSPTLPDAAAPSHTIPITLDLPADSVPRVGRIFIDPGDGKGERSVDVFFSK